MSIAEGASKKTVLRKVDHKTDENVTTQTVLGLKPNMDLVKTSRTIMDVNLLIMQKSAKN